MNNQMKYMDNIVDFFSVLENKIQNRNSLNLYDINKRAENFYRDFLKLVYGYNLRNANEDEKNYPYIDLFGTYLDSEGNEKDIAIQVTSQNGNGKIVDTIQGFYKDDKDKKSELRILLIANDAKKYTTDFTENGKFTFNHKDDVVDIKRLLAKIETKTTKELESIWDLLEKDAIKFVSDSENPLSIPKFVPPDFPARLKYFTGRENVLKNIADALQEHKTVAIADTHGVGKSSVVNEFAYRNQESYKHILFIRAAKGEFDISISKILASLKINLSNDAIPEQRLSAFQDWLSRNDNWLLLVDNVDDVDEVFNCNFNKQNGQIIYTSNDSQIYKVGTKIDLPKMSDDNAVLLLYKHWQNDEHATFEQIPENYQNTLKEIAEKFGNHPFSMAFVGSYLADEDESLDEFLAAYQSKQSNLLVKYKFLSAYQHKQVATAFLLRFEQISTHKDDSEREKFLSVAVIDYLKLSAYIGTDNIPEELFQQCLAKLYPNQSSLTDDKTFIKEIYKRFKPTSIFKRDAETKTLTTHRIVQEIMRFQIGDEEDLLLETLAEVLADNFEHFDFSNKAIVERNLPHIGIFLEYLEKAKQNDQAILKIENESTAKLSNNYATYFEEYAQYKIAEKFYVFFRDICESIESINRDLLATSYNNLAFLYCKQVKYPEAELLYQKASSILAKKFGENHHRTAVVYNNLAELYRTQGRFDEAKPLHKKALGIRKKELGENHIDTAQSYNNVALLLLFSESNSKEIEPFFIKGLEIRKNQLGKNHPDTATSYDNLASYYNLQGRYAEAEHLYRIVIEIFENEFGENHPETATSYNNLGTLYCHQQRYEEGGKLLEKALTIYQNLMGNEHPNTITTSESLQFVNAILRRTKGYNETKKE